MNANAGQDKGEKLKKTKKSANMDRPIVTIPDLEFSSISVPISDLNIGSVHP